MCTLWGVDLGALHVSAPTGGDRRGAAWRSARRGREREHPPRKSREVSRRPHRNACCIAIVSLCTDIMSGGVASGGADRSNSAQTGVARRDPDHAATHSASADHALVVGSSAQEESAPRVGVDGTTNEARHEVERSAGSMSVGPVKRTAGRSTAASGRVARGGPTRSTVDTAAVDPAVAGRSSAPAASAPNVGADCATDGVVRGVATPVVARSEKG